MRNPKIQLVVGILLSAVFLYIAMRGVKPADLWLAVKSFNWLWAVPFLALTFISMWIRAWRWKYLMAPTADLSSRRLFSPMMAGFAINSLLPARAGEFARAYILGKKEKLPFTSVFGTIVVERIFDSITLLLMLGYVFATITFDPSIEFKYGKPREISYATIAAILGVLGGVFVAGGGWLIYRAKQSGKTAVRNVGVLVAAVGAICLLCLVLFLGKDGTYRYGQEFVISGASLKQMSAKIAIGFMVMLAGALLLLWPAARTQMQRWAAEWPYAPRGFRVKISAMIGSFAEGFSSLKSVRIIAIVLIQSIVVWAMIAVTFQIMPYGIPGMKGMDVTQATALLVISCIAIIIPAAPGYWGLMELGIVFGLKILGIESDPSRALAYSLLLHGLQYFPIVAVGLYCLWKEQITISEISHRTETPA